MKRLIILFMILTICSTSFAKEIKIDSEKAVEKTLKKKSLLRAMVSSAIIPGTGEYYAGAKKRAISFMGLACVSWGSFLYTKERVDDYRTEYEELAYLYAGIPDPKYGYEDEFYKKIGIYESSEEYRARVDSDYNGITWNWTANPISLKKWEDYIDARSSKKDTEKIEKGIKGAVIFLHAISALDALISTRIYNKNIEEKMSLEFDLQEKDNPTIRFCLKRKF